MKKIQIAIIFTHITICSGACGGAPLTDTSVPGEIDEGLAAYYSDRLVGNKTASGEPYDKNALTAAHRYLRFGTIIRVTNLENRKWVNVRINDRGPFNSRKRIVDLSRKAAERIDMIKKGVVPVRIEIVSLPK